MKKIILTLTLLLPVLLLTACGGTIPEAGAPQTSADAPEFTIPPETALLIGTVRLDETDQAIDAAQATELLPLWKALRSLSESETASSLEVDALINQIQDTMTAEQMGAISAMNLTMEDFSALRETLGLEDTGFGGGDITPALQATMQAARESGEAPPEGFGGGQGMGGGPGGGGGETALDPAARETAIAERGGTRGAGVGINTALLDAIIAFLEAK